MLDTVKKSNRTMRYKKPPPAESAAIMNTNRQVMNMQDVGPEPLHFVSDDRLVLPRAPVFNEMMFFRNVANHEGPAISPENVGPGLRGCHMSLVNDVPLTHRLPYYHQTFDD
jgi:hypothetical protein